jgi:hypothetical protein
MRGERDESEGTTPMKQCEYVFEERQETIEMDVFSQKQAV